MGLNYPETTSPRFNFHHLPDGTNWTSEQVIVLLHPSNEGVSWHEKILFIRRKQLRASSARETTGSFSLNDVLSDAGGIIAAIFEPPQSFDQSGRHRLAPENSDDSAHAAQNLFGSRV